MFAVARETRFAKGIIKRLLKSHKTISAKNPGLAGSALYKEVLLHSRLVSAGDIDKVLSQSEDSADEWTSKARDRLHFRQVVHFVVMSLHAAAGNEGAVASFRGIVYSLVPEDL
ncbi:MAG: hypothetical protein OEY74_07325 [Gammaproteobacteria bacterium]|nr:hypothetical protein [Gammaproteobacteria bacterium]